jgi:hypothetical protein
VVFSLGSALFGGGSKMKQRIKRVALEREKLRAEEMARLRGGDKQDQRGLRRVAGREYMRNVVDRFSLQKLFADENRARSKLWPGRAIAGRGRSRPTCSCASSHPSSSSPSPSPT